MLSLSTPTVKLQTVLRIMVHGKVATHRLDQSRYEIGRSIQCSIRIPHPEVSRLQATILRDPQGRYQIQDADGLGTESTNGTYVNGTRIRHRLLQVGDVIHLGSSQVKALFNQEPVELDPPSTPSTPYHWDDDVTTELIFLN